MNKKRINRVKGYLAIFTTLLFIIFALPIVIILGFQKTNDNHYQRIENEFN